MPPRTDPSTLTGRSRADPGGADPSGGQLGQSRRAATDHGEQPDRPVVLVVEDELLVAMLLRFILENLGYSVCALARSAPDAVAAAERHRPDVVMMDIRLADDTDGIVAAREIRDRFGIGSIFATAQSDAATKRRAEAARPLGFIGKPYVEPAVAAALERACAGGER